MLDEYIWRKLVDMDDETFDVVLRLSTGKNPEWITPIVQAAARQRMLNDDDMVGLEAALEEARRQGGEAALKALARTRPAEAPEEAPDGP